MNRRLVLLATLVLATGCPPDPDPEPGPDPTPEPEPEMINAFDREGPFGEMPYDIAEDFDFEGREGEFDLSEAWTGEDTYVFIQRQPNGYSQAMWESDLGMLFFESQPNVHYFFASARTTWEADLDYIEDRLEAEFESMGSDDEEHWRPRVHIADTERGEINGTVEAVFESDWAGYGFAIDRFQRLRELGLMQFVGDGFTGDIRFAAYPSRLYDFEYERAVRMAANPPDHTIELWDEFQMEGDRAEVVIDVPDVGNFDTLEVDLTMGCTDHLDANCFEWDYKARMDLCSLEVDAPKEPASCDPGETDAEGNVLEPPETQACTCTSSYAGEEAAERTCQPVTDEEGNVTGGVFNDCPCGCSISFARWITPYHREGRWVTDISPMLAHMQHPGPTRVFIDLDYPFVVSSELRFADRGSETVPFAAVRTWGGGGFGSGYNDAHQPIAFTAPEGTVGVKVHALITGHGFNGDSANCSEFCPHAHHFQLNGGEWHTHEFNEARDFMGCAEQTHIGALPNQFGTWYLGRGGWCPGMDVAPIIFDLTDDFLPGVENTVTYQASLNGDDPANHGSIWMDSYLVFYRER